MAIVPIKKIQIVSHRDDIDGILQVAQEVGAVEFKKVDSVENFSGEYLTNKDEYLNIISKVKFAISYLSKYETKLVTFAQLKKGTIINISPKQIDEKIPNDKELDSIICEIDQTQCDLNNIHKRIESLTERKNTFLPWVALDAPLDSLKTKNTVTYLLKFASSNNKENVSLVDVIEKTFSEMNIDVFTQVVDSFNLAAVSFYKTEVNIQSLIKKMGGEIIQLPEVVGTPKEEVARLEKEIIVSNQNLDRVRSRMTELADKHLQTLRIAYDAFSWKQDLQETLGSVLSSKRVAVFEGWCNADKLVDLKKSLEKNYIVFVLNELKIADNEEPPVELKNHPLIKPFEIVTKLSGLPSYRDLDPTPFMAFFFAAFFGLALTDVGYGATLMLLSLPFLIYFAVSKSAKQFAQLIFTVGLSTVIIGAFFGGYFGINMKLMPEFLQSIQMFDPIANPLPVFYLALSIGVVQVMFGIFLKVVSEAKNGRFVDGLLTQGTWLFLFISLILYGASVLGYMSLNVEKLQIVIYAAIASVMIGNGMIGQTMGEKIKLSLLSAYGSVSYFSDILSYSRLLALGLATSALAFAVNLIAGMVNEMIPYVGVLLAIIVLIVGHAFTLAINTLGSFIHSARLQFVEFFGKFINGSGREFRPLTRKETYINLIEDSG